ncbi:hypothetical protein [Kordia sp.]|uniref:hypothetical protein n=1 Tax=Kordia sp. TaxID=1965332 RepID=UPI003D283E75
MEAIRLVFFVLGVFFGVETTSVVAEKTIVTVDPTSNVMEIHLKNLVAVYPKENDPTLVEKEFSEMYANKGSWNSLFDTYLEKSIVYTSPKKGVLDATITLKYSKPEDLKIFAIDINREGKYSFINIPQWNVETTDGVQNSYYWNFEPNATFSFSLSPLKNAPETYTINKETIFVVWQLLKKK